MSNTNNTSCTMHITILYMMSRMIINIVTMMRINKRATCNLNAYRIIVRSHFEFQSCFEFNHIEAFQFLEDQTKPSARDLKPKILMCKAWVLPVHHKIIYIKF